VASGSGRLGQPARIGCREPIDWTGGGVEASCWQPGRTVKRCPKYGSGEAEPSTGGSSELLAIGVEELCLSCCNGLRTDRRARGMLSRHDTHSMHSSSWLVGRCSVA